MRIVTAFAALACCVSAGNPQALPADAFEHLKLLVGEWQADLPGQGKLNDSIRLVSNGEAIEETTGIPADSEVSIYTRDDNRVLLTHFCTLTPEGHVARLETGPLSGSPERLEFIFLGATNLHGSAAPHMRRVLLIFTDRNHFAERWTKTESGKDTDLDLKFERVGQRSSPSDAKSTPSPSHWLML